MHSQREHANFLVAGKGAAYLLIIKRNQPHLYRQLKALPWGAVPVSDHTRSRGHGRDEIRRLQVLTTGGLLFPHAVQAIRVTRRTRPLGSRRWRTITVYALTNLSVYQASPAHLADYLRGHWAIEALHHIRDVTYGDYAVLWVMPIGGAVGGVCGGQGGGVGDGRGIITGCRGSRGGCLWGGSVRQVRRARRSAPVRVL